MKKNLQIISFIILIFWSLISLYNWGKRYADNAFDRTEIKK